MKQRLIVVETHPIQYKAPLFRLLAADPRVDLTVLYAMLPDQEQQGTGFGVTFSWDVPLLEGYRYDVLDNVSPHPAVNRFGGCDTPGLYDRLRRAQPDAVLVNGWVVKTCLQALWACRRLGIPCMVRGEANLLRPRPWWKHTLHRLLLGQYQAYLSIGAANREFYRFHNCRADRIFDAPYAVDNDYFATAAAQHAGHRPGLRAGFGIPEEARTFLFAGKLERKKHLMDLLDALALLSPETRQRAHLLVAGDGPLRGECERSARARNLPVTFAGFLNQTRLPEAYAAADVLILPSDTGETWGLVVNEAMASGRPAVVSRAVGCCQDLVVEGETGHAFDLHDVQTLSSILERYVREPARAPRQGRSAGQHIQSFCMASIVDGIVAAMHHATQHDSPVEAAGC